jgi:hypothetical protein
MECFNLITLSLTLFSAKSNIMLTTLFRLGSLLGIQQLAMGRD